MPTTTIDCLANTSARAATFEAISICVVLAERADRLVRCGYLYAADRLGLKFQCLKQSG